MPLKHLKHLKYTLATCVFSATSTCCSDDWRLINAELDASTELDAVEWRLAPVEKAVSAVENVTASGWPSGEEGWWAVALERGGERGTTTENLLHNVSLWGSEVVGLVARCRCFK